MPPIEEETNRNELHFLEWLDAYGITIQAVEERNPDSSEFVISAENLAQVAEEHSAAKKLRASEVVKALLTKEIKGIPMVFGNGFSSVLPNDPCYNKPAWCYTVLIENAEQYSMFYGYLGVGETEKEKQKAYERQEAKINKYLGILCQVLEAIK